MLMTNGLVNENLLGILVENNVSPRTGAFCSWIFITHAPAKSSALLPNIQPSETIPFLSHCGLAHQHVSKFPRISF